jgi:protein gp37
VIFAISAMALGVPCLFKQWGRVGARRKLRRTADADRAGRDYRDGEWEFSTMTPGSAEGMHCDDEPVLYRCGKKAAGRHLDGRTHDEFPRGVA